MTFSFHPPSMHAMSTSLHYNISFLVWGMILKLEQLSAEHVSDYCYLMLNWYVVCITRVASVQRVVQLYQNYHRLSDIMRSGGGGGAKAGGGAKGGGGAKRGRPTAGTSSSSAAASSGGAKSIPKSLLSVRMAAAVLKALFK